MKKKDGTPTSIMGRPKKRFDKKQFEALCAIQCTEEEILAVLDTSDKTLYGWCKDTYGKSFSEVFREKKAGGRMSLRRKQWNLAETNASMAIFLGKQYLGQTDKVDQSLAVKSIEVVNDIPTEETDD